MAGGRGSATTFGGANPATAAAKTDYGTPRELYDELDREFRFAVDAAANEANHKAARWIGPGGFMADALSPGRWARRGQAAFLNPPYSKHTPDFVARARLEARGGIVVVCLLPARTETRWWQASCAGSEVRLVRGRIRFDGGRVQAPFAPAIVVMRPGDPEPLPGRWQVMVPESRQLSAGKSPGLTGRKSPARKSPA